MNTAPKLPATGPYVDRIVRIFRDKPHDDGIALALKDYAEAAIAALAPPIGEGVVSGLDDATLLRSLAEDVDDMAPEIRTQLRLIADHINTGKIRCRRCGEHADVRISTATLPTTPQSAPDEVYKLLRDIRPALACEDTFHPCTDLRRRIDKFLATPPPASQERGEADRVIRKLWALMGPKVPPCCEGCNFEWTKAIEEMRAYLGSDAYPAASPPSSAADEKIYGAARSSASSSPAGSDDAVEGSTPSASPPFDAAGQAKPVTVENAPIGTLAPAIGGGHWCRVQHGWKWNGPNGNGGTFPRPGGDWNGKLTPPVAEQAQAGALPPLPVTTYCADADGTEPLYTADQMREYRLAGGVTVDDALKAADDLADEMEANGCGPCIGSHNPFEDALGRYRAARAALVAALGAK